MIFAFFFFQSRKGEQPVGPLSSYKFTFEIHIQYVRALILNKINLFVQVGSENHCTKNRIHQILKELQDTNFSFTQ